MIETIATVFFAAPRPYRRLDAGRQSASLEVGH
jgi:hypothetical protein